METVTSKRPGRPRKTVEPVHVEPEAGEQYQSNAGDREASEQGVGVSKIAPEKGQGIDWLGLMDAIKAENRMVVRCWHPEPNAESGEWKNGINFEVKHGAAAYQLTTGEIVSL